MQVPQSPKNGRADHELKNLRALGSLIARSALARGESRGSHYRSDLPYRDDDEFQKHSLISKDLDVTFKN
jgi:succinate dehydrogenase/fumarate reductase flavoprotein subunit